MCFFENLIEKQLLYVRKPQDLANNRMEAFVL